MKSSVLAESPIRQSLEWPKTDFSNKSVDLDEIESGGPPKDGIPAIDTPRFILHDEAESWLHSDEPVIVLNINDDVRAYPIQIMIYHEIVNDVVGNIPVTVTFCPLCNATIVFDRRIDGKVLDFGTTGKLRKNDLVMYDRQTESWWQQFNGTGIVGKYTGVKLKQIPAAMVSYTDFKEVYPQGKILSKKTGYLRSYGTNPYQGYDAIDNSPFLYNDPVDKRLRPMERILFIRSNKLQRLYPFNLFSSHKVINDTVGNQSVVIFSKSGTLSPLDAGKILRSRKIPSVTAWSRKLEDRILHFESTHSGIRDKETGSTWNLLGRAVSGELKGKQLNKVDSGVHFAFAWLAFNPDSEIYSVD